MHLSSAWAPSSSKCSTTPWNWTAPCLGALATLRQHWSGAGHLEGQAVRVVADGIVVGDAIVEGGSITLAVPALGAARPAFTHLVEPLPPSIGGAAAGQGGGFVRYRSPLAGVGDRRSVFGFRTRPRSGPFKRFGGSILDQQHPFSDVTIRTLRWQDTGIQPLAHRTGRAVAVHTAFGVDGRRHRLEHLR